MQEQIINPARDIVVAAYAQDRSTAVPAALMLSILLALLAAPPLLSLVASASQAAQETSEARPPTAAPRRHGQARRAGHDADLDAMKPKQEKEVASRMAPPAARVFVTDRDTINGHRIADPEIRARIERIAAAVPAHLLAGHRRATHVRYLAHAFGADDDAAISYGVFQEPAAALAFGCAMDDHLAGGCALAGLTGPQAAFEDIPGVHCEPMGVALGAPAYQPDRCEAHG